MLNKKRKMWGKFLIEFILSKGYHFCIQRGNKMKISKIQLAQYFYNTLQLKKWT